MCTTTQTDNSLRGDSELVLYTVFITHGICRTHTDISPKGDNGGMVKHTVIMRHGYVQLCSF